MRRRGLTRAWVYRLLRRTFCSSDLTAISWHSRGIEKPARQRVCGAKCFFPIISLWWERGVAAVVGALNSASGEGGGRARRPLSAGGVVWSAGWISLCCRAKGACHDCRNYAVRFRPAGAGASAERYGNGQADAYWSSVLTGPPCGGACRWPVGRGPAGSGCGRRGAERARNEP